RTRLDRPLVPGVGDLARRYLADHARRAGVLRPAARRAGRSRARRRVAAGVTGNKKPGVRRVFRVWRLACGSGGLQRLDARGQAALVAGGLVAVDQATRAEAVEDRLGDVERGLGAG